jgi:hypothetical protein
LNQLGVRKDVRVLFPTIKEIVWSQSNGIDLIMQEIEKHQISTNNCLKIMTEKQKNFHYSFQI